MSKSFFVDQNVKLSNDTVWVSPQGHVRCNAIVTAAKVLRYYDSAGTAFDILRHPDDVFNDDSLATLSGVPITLGHPVVDGKNVLVTPENWQEFGVGVVGDSISKQNPYVKIDGLSIQAEIALAAIQAGTKQLSPGYEADIIEESGVYDGVPYQLRQKNIVYNHMAILEEGRTGVEVRLLMGDSTRCFLNDSSHKFEEKTVILPTKKMTKSLIVDVKGLPKTSYLISDDGEVTISAEDLQKLIGLNEETFASLTALQASMPADEMVAAPADMPPMMDSVTALIDGYNGLKAANEVLEKSVLTTDAIQAFAKKRSELIARVSPFVVVDHAQSDRQIKEGLLKAHDSTAVYTDSSDATVDGAYGAVIKIMESRDTNTKKQARIVTDEMQQATVGDLATIQKNIRAARKRSA